MRGGEQRNENDQSVTQVPEAGAVVNSIRSAWTGEPSTEWRSLPRRGQIRWQPGEPRSSR